MHCGSFMDNHYSWLQFVIHTTSVRRLTKLVYAHDGESVYDELFLNEFEQRYDVSVFTFHRSPSYIPVGLETVKMRDLIPATNLHPFEGMRKHLLTPVRALAFRRNLKRIEPDVLIGCWASTYGFYSAYSRFHPFILFVWGSDVLLLPTKYFPLKPLVVYSLRRADAVVVDSEVQREAVIRLGCGPEKIVKFPWVNLSGFMRNEDQRSTMRKEFGWTEDNIVVVSLRNHRPIYGVEYLINAVPLITQRNRNVRFLILGQGPLTRLFKEKMKRFIESGHVKFIGTVPHEKVAGYLSAADIYVSTSFSDGTSAGLLEAMACSLPTVVTDIDGNREWVQNEINGFLVPVANSEKLAENILLLADSQELREKLIVKAKQTIRTKVNWKKNMQTLMDTIDRTVSAQR